MNLQKMLTDDKIEMQVTPLIDVVFLLLIYFMVTSALQPKEADIAFLLPAQVTQTDPIDIPIEVIIEINRNGNVVVEGTVYVAADQELIRLSTKLARLSTAASTSQSMLVITITPSEEVLQSRIIEVMNACDVADVKNISFNLNS
jgi:biopolymer transport protein ExbD